MNILKKILFRGTSGLLLLAAGCFPMSDKEREYFDNREKDREQRESIKHAISGDPKGLQAIDLTKKSPAEAGGGTVLKWVHRRHEAEGGDIITPRWTARPLTANKYEVFHKYRVLKDSKRIETHGFVWQVDMLLRTVSKARRIEASELFQRQYHTPKPDAKRKPRSLE